MTGRGVKTSSERVGASSYLQLAIRRLEESRSEIDAKTMAVLRKLQPGKSSKTIREERRTQLHKEAIGYFCLEVGLPELGEDRQGWIDALRFLNDAAIFSDQLGPLRLALSELDRGAQDPRLVPADKGKKVKERPRGGGANTDEMFLRAAAVEAFDILVERSGKGPTEVELDLNVETTDSDDVIHFHGRTIRKWREALKKSPWIERPRHLRLFLLTEEDARAHLLRAYAAALSPHKR